MTEEGQLILSGAPYLIWYDIVHYTLQKSDDLEKEGERERTRDRTFTLATVALLKTHTFCSEHKAQPLTHINVGNR